MTAPFGIALSTTGAGAPLTTTVDSPAGNSIIIVVGGNWSGGSEACTDSAGNTYGLTRVPMSPSGAEGFLLFYSTTTLHLPAGSSITIADIAGPVFVQAISTPTLLAPDFVGGADRGRTGNPTVTSGALAAPGELCVGMWIIYPGGGIADNYLSSPPGWLNIMAGDGHSLLFSGTGSAKALVDCKINPTSAAVTYGPSDVFPPPSEDNYVALVTFTLAAPPPPPARRRGKRARFI
jgi:hypothetical protein